MGEKVLTVNFGSSKASLATVGYTLLTDAGAEYQARTTTGVYELGTATGIYGSKITFPDTWSGSIIWDTGEATPKYAGEELNFYPASAGGASSDGVVDAILPQLRQVQKSIIDYMSDHLEMKFKGIKETDLSGLERRLEALEKKLPLKIPAPVVNIPEVKIPKAIDYSGDLKAIQGAIAKLPAPVDYSAKLAEIMTNVDGRKLAELQRANLEKFAAGLCEAMGEVEYPDYTESIDKFLGTLSKLVDIIGDLRLTSLTLKGFETLSGKLAVSEKEILRLVRDMSPENFEKRKKLNELLKNNGKLLMGLKAAGA